jgi:hypothetical protein
MSYKLSFGDGDAESGFWDHMSGYIAQIRKPDGTEADYQICGMGYDETTHMPTLEAFPVSEESDWLPADDAEVVVIPLTGDEEIHIY